MGILNGLGDAQQLVGAQMLLRNGAASTGTKRKRTKKKPAAVARAVKRGAVRKPARLAKGSAAAKAYMAKLRKMRKR